jgi:hypothetical protein
MPVVAFIRATQWPDTQLPTTTRPLKFPFRTRGLTDFGSSVFGHGD